MTSQYLKYLKPNFSKDECENSIKKYKFVPLKNKRCNICSCVCDLSYNTYITEDSLCIKSCYMCHVITNFKKYHANKLLLIKSNLTQSEIIKQIAEYFYNYKQIPIPNVIDENCLIVKELDLVKYFYNQSAYPNVKIYFNPNITNYIEDATPNMFFKKTQNNENDNDTLKKYEIVKNFYEELDEIATITILPKKYQKSNEQHILDEVDNNFKRKKGIMKNTTEIKNDCFMCLK